MEDVYGTNYPIIEQHVAHASLGSVLNASLNQGNPNLAWKKNETSFSGLFFCSLYLLGA